VKPPGPRAAIVAGVLIIAGIAVVTALRTSGAASRPATVTRPLAQVPPVPVTQLRTSLVASGPAQRYGESVSAVAGNTSVVAATTWLPAETVVQTWKRQGAAVWGAPTPLLAPGFRRSYDPSAVALPDGTILASAGTDLALRPYCLDGGSVVVRNLSAAGNSPPVLVDDQRGSTSFDDRPTLAAGAGTQVWAGWSHGTAVAACDAVGRDDRIHIALSRDDGGHFGPSIALPTDGTGGDFGVEIAAIGPNHAFVAWSELAPSGTFRILLDDVQIGQPVPPPVVVATGTALPQYLPGSSFLTITTPSLVLVDGRPWVAWAALADQRSVVDIAVSPTAGNEWRRTVIASRLGEDLILPALSVQPNGTVLELDAAHIRATDAVRFEVRSIGTNLTDGHLPVGPARSLNAPLEGPGYHELGESLVLATYQTTTATALVVGGEEGSRIMSVVWKP